jgi:hypothetical protein
MTTLDDFFGDSKAAVQECLYCGGTDGELEVAISDNYGPTHWRHFECHAQALAEEQRQAEANADAVARQEYHDESDGFPTE